VFCFSSFILCLTHNNYHRSFFYLVHIHLLEFEIYVLSFLPRAVHLKMSFAFFLIRPAGKWVGRLGKSPFPPVAAKNLHRETANLFAAIRRANISDRRLDSNAADQEDLEDRASYPRITGAQLYGMCCGRLPANFDSDCARFLIDAKDFHSAHNRLKARSS
jgi:hypothetical protein